MSGTLYTGPLGDHRRYRVDLQAGELESIAGGEGLVFEAIGPGGTRFALKMVTAVPLDAYGRVVERLEPLGGVQHPGLMRHVEVFLGPALTDNPAEPPAEDFDVIYTVAEWVDGHSLTALVGDAAPRQRLRWLGQVTDAVHCLHSQVSPGAPNGIVHRDIKPSNVRVTPDDVAVLMDFGIARPNTDDDHTRGAGTFNWQAPEVLTGLETPGPAADIWAIGALGYWLFTGEPPRLEGRGAARERLRASARELDLGDQNGLVNHLSWPLESNPRDRPHDLARWARELQAIASRRRTPLMRRRGVRVAAVAAVGVPLATLGTTTGLDRLNEPTTPTVLGEQVQRLSVEEVWDVPCDGVDTTTPGSGAPPGTDVVYVVRSTQEPGATTTTALPPSATTTTTPETAPTVGDAVQITVDDPESGGGTQISRDPAVVEPEDVDLSLIRDETKTAFENGSFILDFACRGEQVGAEWLATYETADGQRGETTIRGIEPIVGFTSPLSPSEDGRVHVAVTTEGVLVPSPITVREGVVDESALGLEATTVLSSDPEVLSVERQPIAPNAPSQTPGFLFTARRPGNVTVTVRLRSVETTFDVTVD